MAQFDAGSIVGTLDLDRDPYTLGLDLARQQAEDFESNTITAKVDLADTEAKAKLDELIAKESEAAKQVDVDVDVQGAPEAVAELESVKRAADGASGISSGGGMSKLIMLALALAPALLPIGAVGGAGLVAFAGGVTQAVAALAPFALVAKGDFTDMTTATKNLAKAQSDLESAQTTQQKAKAIKELADAEKALAGPMGQAATAYGLVIAAAKKLKEDTAGPVFGVMIQAFQLAAQILPELEPVIVSTAKGISSMLDQFKESINGPIFKEFLNLVTKNIAPDLALLGRVLVNFGEGFANLIIGLDPITHKIYNWIAGISEKFTNWTGDGGFAGFLDYVNREAGPVGGLLSSIWDALKNISTVAAPFGELLLGPLTTFFKVIADVDLAPMSKALGDLVVAVSPVLPALGQIVNDILPGFTPLLEAIVPLVANLANAFADLVRDLPPEFVRDIGLLGGAFWVLNAAMDANPIILAAVAFGLLVSALPRGWAEVIIGIAAAIWVLNAALDANIFVAIAIAIAAVVIGLIYAVKEIIKHWSAIVGFFRGLWNEVWAFFHTGVGRILLAFIPFIGIPLTIIENWHKIAGFFSGLWSDIYGFFAKYGHLIGDVLLLILLWPLALYENWGKITAFFAGLWADILNGVIAGWNAVTNFISKVPGAILGFFAAAPGWLYNTGLELLHGLKTGAVDGFDAVWTWLIGLPGTIAKAAVGMWDGLGAAFKDIINTIIGWWDSFVDHLHIHIPAFTLIPGTFATDPVKVGPIDADLGSKEMHINKLADGAFIAARLGGVFANIGEGSSDEAVVPLDRWDVTRKGQGAGFTDAQVAAIIAAIRSLPEATGQAVGSTVGDKFKAATDAQTRKLQTAGRTG